MAHWLLQYEYVPDIVTRRGPHRAAHLQAIARQHDAGHLILAGAHGDPPHGGTFVFVDVDRADVEAFARDDPYAQAGLVRSSRIEPLAAVVSPVL